MMYQNTGSGFQFQKATKHKTKLRCALFSPAGGGKTMTALRIATGIASCMNGRIAVIDTEFGTASKYADRFNFDVCNLTEPTVQNYINLIHQAGPNYDVLVIDSTSHGWQEILEMIDHLKKTKYKGNSFAAWSEGTPLQREFVKAIQSCPCHIIATMRSKTEWLTQDENGKSRPVRVGLTPEQGKGIEYEFDMLLEMNTEHFCTVIKDRTGKFQDAIFEKPSEEFGKALFAWLNEGAEIPPQQQFQPSQQPQGSCQPPQQQFQQPPQQQATQPAQGYPQPGEPFQKPNHNTNPGSGGNSQPGPNYPQQQETGPAQTGMPNGGQTFQHPEVPENCRGIMSAIHDFFRKESATKMNGLDVPYDKLCMVVHGRYGKYPSIQSGADRVKREVQINEVVVQSQQVGAA